MNEPLEIMNEIERDSRSFPDLKPINAKIARETQWQSLRTATERQAKYIELLKSVEKDKEEECREQFIKLEAQAEALAQAQARIACLEESLSLLQEATLQTYRAGRVEALCDVLEIIDPDERGEDAIRHIEKLIDRIEQEAKEND